MKKIEVYPNVVVVCGKCMENFKHCEMYNAGSRKILSDNGKALKETVLYKCDGCGNSVMISIDK